MRNLKNCMIFSKTANGDIKNTCFFRVCKGKSRGESTSPLWCGRTEVYFNGSSDRDLFSESILKNDGPLRKALFSDFNRCWQMYEGALALDSCMGHGMALLFA